MLSWDELYLVINGKRKLTKEERENLIERIDYAECIDANEEVVDIYYLDKM